jgi:hypothetical protein
MIAKDVVFELSIEPGWTAIAEPLDGSTTETIRRLVADARPAPLSVQVAPTDAPDVGGHAIAGSMIDVLLTVGDDVEGHAFSLRFPSTEDAQLLRTRLAAGGLLIAVLAVGSVSIGAQQGQTHTVTGPAAQEAGAIGSNLSDPSRPANWHARRP